MTRRDEQLQILSVTRRTAGVGPDRNHRIQAVELDQRTIEQSVDRVEYRGKCRRRQRVVELGRMGQMTLGTNLAVRITRLL